jgi:hypothetical protein
VAVLLGNFLELVVSNSWKWLPLQVVTLAYCMKDLFGITTVFLKIFNFFSFKLIFFIFLDCFDIK